MNVLFKYVFIATIIFSSLNVFAQNEYEDDLEFETFGKKQKEKKHFEGKRKVNVHFGVGYNFSAILGSGVVETRDTLNAVAKRFNLDSYNIVPSYWPTASVEMSLNFIEKTSLVFGLKYNMLGWSEFAKVDDSNFYFRFRSKYEFHNLSVPVAIHFHPKPFVGLYIGTALSFNLKNQIIVKEIQVFNQDTLINNKEILDFDQTTGVETRIMAPQLFFGSHFGFDRFRLNLNFIFTPNFIRNDIPYNNISAEAGIIIKLFKDYDKDF